MCASLLHSHRESCPTRYIAPTVQCFPSSQQCIVEPLVPRDPTLSHTAITPPNKTVHRRMNKGHLALRLPNADHPTFGNFKFLTVMPGHHQVAAGPGVPPSLTQCQGPGSDSARTGTDKYRGKLPFIQSVLKLVVCIAGPASSYANLKLKGDSEYESECPPFLSESDATVNTVGGAAASGTVTDRDSCACV